MSVFSLDFTQLPPENYFFPMVADGLQEEDVYAACTYLRDKYGQNLTVNEMEDAFDKFGIDYNNLPSYLKDEFDNFDII